jgi:hypothetical protein
VPPKPIEIFRPGRHTAMSGQVITFSEGDLAASAAAYDPALHEAPLCVGHPAHDAPAYGWVGGLKFAAGSLEAAPQQVDPAFAELVTAGRFKKISAAFYAPGAAGNPKPGVYYLRHVAFLGAQPPALKGLKPVQFAASDDGVVVFGDYGDRMVASLFRKLRDHLIGRDGQDAADRALPPDDLDALADDAAQPDCPEGDTMTSPAYAEQQRQAAEARQRELDERERKLKDRETTIAAKDAAFAEEEKTRRQGRNIAAVEALVRAGQAIPAERALLLAFLERLEPAEKMTVAFGEDGAEQEVTAAHAFRTWLSVALPQRWSFGEAAAVEVARAGRRAAVQPFEVPKGLGARVDRNELELRDRALAYAAEHKVDFIEAVKLLEKAEA